ncbi:MAG: flagella basal body P-ring formation protein FlgA [Candidatus Acidiferrales bacterium]|jgi:hypothetical protein
MKLRWKDLLVKTTIANVLIFGGSAHAARLPRIELLRAATVSGTQVLLSDLLPAGAPESLRTLAADISLGAAPQAGNARVLERDAVERDASASLQVLSEVSVPERMVVSRDERPITLSEVFTAIRRVLVQNGMPSAGTLRAEDILLESQILVRPGDAGLQVMRMDFDRGLRRARFLLWPSHDPRVLPFYVTARFGAGLPSTPIQLITQISRSGNDSGVASTRERSEMENVLVAQGEHATLTLQSAAVRIFADVVCLGNGMLGQQIRVRLLDSGKVFNARVDGKSRLEATF